MKRCPKCNEEHEKPGTFCSRKCANSRTWSEKDKEKRSFKTKEAWRFGVYNHKRKEIKNICVICNFSFIKKKKQKTCSEECENYLHSLNRQKTIKEKGTSNWRTKQELFSYKFVSEIVVDSKLEQAAIIYLIDVFKVDKIEKYENILNFWEGDKHKTFNPDFYCKKNNEVYIVEVKMKWTKNSTHHYNRTIPYKREALEKYCKAKNYNMIWLDFDYDDRFRIIYKQLLSF